MEARGTQLASTRCLGDVTCWKIQCFPQHLAAARAEGRGKQQEQQQQQQPQATTTKTTTSESFVPPNKLTGSGFPSSIKQRLEIWYPPKTRRNAVFHVRLCPEASARSPARPIRDSRTPGRWRSLRAQRSRRRRKAELDPLSGTHASTPLHFAKGC